MVRVSEQRHKGDHHDHHRRADADIVRINSALDRVFDPELPGITIRELGILRDVEADENGITVWLTPTWSGCPALDEINRNVRECLDDFGRPVHIRQRLSPAWSSRWLSDSAKTKLAAMNIAPPDHSGRGDSLLREHKIIECPCCGHRHTQLISECGSTACKAFYSCPSCRNIFEYFKDI